MNRKVICHYVKSWPLYFESIIQGNKTWDVRAHDRDFRIGDTLGLLEYDIEKGFTGGGCVCYIKRVWQGIPGLRREHVVLDIAQPHGIFYYEDCEVAMRLYAKSLGKIEDESSQKSQG